MMLTYTASQRVDSKRPKCCWLFFCGFEFWAVQNKLKNTVWEKCYCLKNAIEMEKNWVCHIFIEDRVELPTMGWKWVGENGIPITLQKWIITDSGANSAAAQRQLGQILTQPKWAIRIVSSLCITRENTLQIYSKQKPAVTTHMPRCNLHLHFQTSSHWLWGIQELPGLEFVVFTLWMQEHHAGASRKSRTAPFPRLLMCVTRALRAVPARSQGAVSDSTEQTDGASRIMHALGCKEMQQSNIMQNWGIGLGQKEWGEQVPHGSPRLYAIKNHLHINMK